ncbi:MAG: hypothetical protein NT157_00080 [Candidatus Micrarchaeota archaeon]|nr:hypothetical protein [Candidatus Micrarchaeota archaeon]
MAFDESYRCEKCGKIHPINVIPYRRWIYLEKGDMCLCDKELYFPKKHYPGLYEKEKMRPSKRKRVIKSKKS